MIGSIRLRNFKCFRDITLPLGRMTILSGLNGMGKSSVLQALLLLRQSHQLGLLSTRGLALNGDLVQLGSDPIPLLLQALGDEGEIKEEMVETCCLSTLDQVGRRETWIRKRMQSEVRTGAELWKRRESLLKRLAFCADAVEQVQKLTGREPYFRQILRHLFEFDHYVAEWLSGPFSIAGISWSEESGETLQHPEYGPMRQFLCPDDVERTFSLHTKPTGGNVRIHFLPLREERTAYVAYIGPHLPTVKHKK